MATVDKMPMLAEGYEKLQTEVRHLKTVERPGDHRRDRGSARPWRSFRKRRISCRQGAPGPGRGADRRDRGPAQPRAGHRPDDACRATRSCSAPPSTCSTRTTSRSLPDRRRDRGGRQDRPDLVQLAARPRADRPQVGEEVEGDGAVGRQILRDQEDRVPLGRADAPPGKLCPGPPERSPSRR